MTNLQKYLGALGACAEAREWVGARTLAEAWAECPRADWMLWLAAYCLPRPRLVGVAAEVATTVLHLTDDVRVADCLETCWAFERGEATAEDCRRAAYGTAAYAAYGTAAYAAHTAAYAAAYAADIADLVRRLVPVEALGLEGM